MKCIILLSLGRNYKRERRLSSSTEETGLCLTIGGNEKLDLISRLILLLFVLKTVKNVDIGCYKDKRENGAPCSLPHRVCPSVIVLVFHTEDV